MASNYIIQEQLGVNVDTVVMEVDRVLGSIYLPDSGVHRHHLICISSYHIINIHTLSFWTIDPTHSLQNLVDPHNRMDPQCWVASYLLTLCVHTLRQNSSVSWIAFVCCKRCGGVLIVGSLPPSSIISPQLPPSGASLHDLTGCVLVLIQLWPITICGQIDCMYIFTETCRMHAILWCSKSCDSNKNEYTETKCLVAIQESLLGEYNTESPADLHSSLSCSWRFPQSCAPVTAAFEASHRPTQRLQQLLYFTIL
jgi:hypothetical protein